MIRGEGSEKRHVLETAKNDSRITYWNKLTREELILLQHRATLLINLRNADSESVKYFFPSKTIEYMASGTPCIIRKLPGIPYEYYHYVYTIDCDSLSDLAKMIQVICEKTKKELSEFGAIARNFIIKKKNSKVQCKKIYEMLKQI